MYTPYIPADTHITRPSYAGMSLLAEGLKRGGFCSQNLSELTKRRETGERGLFHGLYPRVMRGLEEREVSDPQGPEPPFNGEAGITVFSLFSHPCTEVLSRLEGSLHT